MNKQLARILILILVGLPFSAISAGLNIYLWEDTLSNKVISDWERKFNYPLNLFHFDNDDERSLLMLKSLQLPFDIIVLDNVSAHIFARQDTFEDLSSLKNRQYIDPRWNKICGTHAIPYFWGSVGIVYRKNKVSSPPQTWSDFINPPPELKGHIGMIQDSVETLLPFLYAHHLSPITDTLSELKAAYQAMTELSPDILTYEYALSYVRSHKNNDNLYMALGYSGDQSSLNRYFQNNNWKFVTPAGPQFLWVDCMAINSNSENKKAAKDFLNYLMQPDIAAQNALDIGAATPNKAALKLLPPSFIHDKSIFPPINKMKNTMIDSELSPLNLNIRAKIINSLINQHEAQP
ncbi:polyamine ABC transporter substrate-binding protein [Vibrio mangrovi]|nr:spermidine/putrescine ABC transporter substrate-binding protein [Vibrio mangrovi]MDW6003151.1 spermidine/putrescine ABC transporter substrate-binding protein [Vibrio mangrovi]